MRDDKEDAQVAALLPNAVGLDQVDGKSEDRDKDVWNVALVQHVVDEDHTAQQIGDHGVKVQKVEQDDRHAVDEELAKVPEIVGQRSTGSAVVATPGSQSPRSRARSPLPPSQPRLHGSCVVAAAATEQMSSGERPEIASPSPGLGYQTQF